MKFKYTIFFITFLTCFFSNGQNNYWTKSKISLSKQVLSKKNAITNNYAVYQLDEQGFKNSLKADNNSHIVYFPNQEGTLIKFQVQEKSNLAPALAAKYTSIKSFRGFAVSDKNLSISFTLSNSGVSALLMSHSNESPVSVTKISGNQYLSYTTKETDNKLEEGNCTSELSNLKKKLTSKNNNTKKAENSASGVRTLRLAVVAPGEYTALVGGTVEAALVAINNTINTANSILEEDLGIVLQLIADNDQLIFTDKTTDPYDIEGQGVSTGSSYINITTQEVIDARIPFNDYDLGHFFIAFNETGSSAYGIGNAFGIGNVGTPEKGSAWSSWSQSDVASNPGFVKLFLHETGHQIGANHTFSFQPDYPFSQVEPSAGRTIMSYGPDHFYYHYYSINQILRHFEANPFDVSLGTITPYNSQISFANLPATNYIPKGTAFYLEVPETGADPSYNYNWEQIDTGLTGSMSFWGPQMVSGPLFSSTVPSPNRIRYFPSLQTILDGELTNNFDSYNGYNQDAQKIGFYETLPSIPRTLSFGVTVRDPSFTKGVYLDSTSVVVVKNTQPFKITSALSAQNFTAGETTTVTWEVGNTNLAPINADAVDILLSIDGGSTFPITLAKNVPNDGSETVGFPNINTTDARIKIHPVNKIFFAINKGSFSIIPSDIVLFFENLNLELNNCDLTSQSFSTTFQYQTAAGFSEISALSIAGLPAGLTANLSQNSVSASNTDINIDFQADETLAAGTYAIDIIATAASKTVTKRIQIIILNSSTAITTLSTPADTLENTSLNPQLSWVANTNATKYRVQVSKDVSFAATVIDTYTFNTNYTAANLDANTTYYWRVSGVNACSENTFSSTFRFTTSQAYEQEFSLISHLKPIGISNGSSTYVITIEDDVPLLDVNVFTSFTGTKNGSLALKLKGPDGTEIALSNGVASDDNTEELNALADDQTDEVPLVSSEIIDMSYTPEQALSIFNGKSIKGDWVLTITNTTNAEGIYIKDFDLKIKASNDYYVPFAISETKTVFGTEKRSINVQATNQDKETISGFSVKISRLPEQGNLLNSTSNAILTLNETINTNTLIYQGTDSNFIGEDYFYFIVNDQAHNSRQAIITLKNLGTYKAPEALPVYAATPVSTPVELTLDIKNFYLKDIATFSLTAPTNGLASYANGTVLYTPNQGFIGKDSFSYTVNDGRSEITNNISVKVFTNYKTNTKPAFMLQGSEVGRPISASIAISGDGAVIATSDHFGKYKFEPTYAGIVKVFNRDATSGIYSQLGSDISGDNGDNLGGFIALSTDGKRIAVATNQNSLSSTNLDYVKVYEYDETSSDWKQIGQTFTFAGGGPGTDLKLDLNANGSILAISNPRGGTTDFGQGIVEVHQFNSTNNQWNLLGDRLSGDLRFGNLGTSISLNATGTIMVVSQPLDPLEYNKPGYVRVYEFDGISWRQKGRTLKGKEIIDRFGTSVSINNDGNVIAVGADYEIIDYYNRPGKSGYVSVYTFNENTNDWELKGETLEGSKESNFPDLLFGTELSLNGTGDILAIGASNWDGFIDELTPNDSFIVVYRYDKSANSWEKLNLSTNNGKINDTNFLWSGSKVALSSDGTTLLNGYRSTSHKSTERTALMTYKIISDTEVEIEDTNHAPFAESSYYDNAMQQIERLFNPIINDPDGDAVSLVVTEAPAHGKLKNYKTGLEIKEGEILTDIFLDGNIFSYVPDANATSDTFKYYTTDGKKYAYGEFLFDPILEPLKLNIKAYLQGPYDESTGLMKDDLRSRNLIPTTSPYQDAITTNANVFNLGGASGNGLPKDDIIDWVSVELRYKNELVGTRYNTSALIQADGDIVDLDGVSPIIVKADLNSGEYYVVIAHRNHLGVITENKITIVNGINNLDLTVDNTLINGGSDGIGNTTDGKIALFSGDYDGDGKVQDTDKSAVEPLRGVSGYKNADIDMNGQVQNSDIQSKLNPNIGKGEKVARKQVNTKKSINK